ncbi:MAG: acetate--CoA ligase [Gammaproteobacteria bacterium]|nr:acetate--CoA ligase [Gammaproteobacteria bacterium]
MTTVYPPFENISKNAEIPHMEAYLELCKKANRSYEAYWAQQANRVIDWYKPFTKILDQSNPPFYKWFYDGELNVSVNCLDRNVAKGMGRKIAFIFEKDDGSCQKITYKDLLARTCQIANVYKTLGIKKGDRVIIYLSVSIDAIACMLACARIGAIHSVIFGGFSAHSIRDRVVDMQAKLIVTADYQMRGGKQLPLKSVVDEALDTEDCACVQRVLVFEKYSQDQILHNPRDLSFEPLINRHVAYCEPEWVNAEHPLFLLYTSGSTGKPKGVQHSSAGYLLHAALTTSWTFDLKFTDIFWCTADIGWITGHTYMVYGPLSLGGTQVIFEGIPTYPHSGRFWEIIEKHRVSIFYTAPTAIRTLIKLNEASPEQHPKNYNLASLRILGSVGEPINPAAWEWYFEHVGQKQCPVLDTFWQTETGGHVITPLPGATPLVAGSCALPFPGIQATIVDDTGEELPWGQSGMLVIKKPWPSMMRTIWGDDERFKNSYFPDYFQGKYYLAGDGAVRDAETGYFTITGRIDDVLNVSGHRMGTMEIESALVSFSELVAEAAVVGRPDETTGEAICAFVVLKTQRPQGEEAHKIAQKLRDHVGKIIGPIAKPKDIRFGDNLPKTRSGKIMRRLLRSIAKGEPITQDISTLENPAILVQLSETN